MKYLLGLFLWIPHQVTTWFVINFLTCDCGHVDWACVIEFDLIVDTAKSL